jgi:hypothetical protein
MTKAEVFAAWATEWTPLLAHLYDKEWAARDSSYNANWLVIEATAEANADLDRRMKTAR